MFIKYYIKYYKTFIFILQLPHWPVLKKLAHTVSCSAVEATLCEENETVSAMASLSMTRHRMQ